MKWGDVGTWLKTNAKTGGALVGALLTGNAPGAIAAGVSLVSAATGSNNPVDVLDRLQHDPEVLVKLKTLELQNEASIREHIESMTRLQLEAETAAHTTTQDTIRAGDKAEDAFIRRTRPAQSWCSLFAAFAYVFVVEAPDLTLLIALLTLPWAYAGLRQVGKGVDSVTAAVVNRNKKQ